MKCPYCSYQEDKVIDSRPTDEGATIRRRRECLSCHKRYTTYEKVESLPVMVVKKDGSRQPYEREKVRKGILRACEKRSVSVDQIESIVDDIESHISNSLEREVTTEFIGELVMERLRGLDEVSYVRFASVYRQFKDINTFMAELNKLLNDK
jgi:transcriptional repressor NrdR